VRNLIKQKNSIKGFSDNAKNNEYVMRLHHGGHTDDDIKLRLDPAVLGLK